MTARRLFWDLRHLGALLRVREARLQISCDPAPRRPAVLTHRKDLIDPINGAEPGERHGDALLAGSDLPRLTGISREDARGLFAGAAVAPPQAEGRHD